ncbi:MAG: GntR family transcriptional regulator [Terrimesophilobacter sp.]
MSTKTFQRPTSTQRAVLDELRRLIHTGQLQPGQQVRQEEVAASLGTSVIPVREALKTLQSEGMLIHHPNRGFFVTKLNRDELIELCLIRSALESLAVEKALAVLDDSVIEQMSELITAMENSDKNENLEELVRLDRAFHFTLFAASRSPQLLRLIDITWDQSDAYRSAFFVDPEHRAATHREHRKILNAATARDADTVTLLLDAHRLTPVQTFSERTL